MWSKLNETATTEEVEHKEIKWKLTEIKNQ